MSQAIYTSIESSTDETTSPRVEVTALYEDSECQNHAVVLRDLIKDRFRQDLEFRFGWWSFSMLTDKTVARKAIERAWISDIILVSMQGTSPLSPEIKNWTEAIPRGRHGRQGALVTIFRNQEIAPASVMACDQYFRVLARRSLMDYLPLPKDQRAHSRADKPTLTSHPGFPFIGTYFNPPESHWGINE